MDKESIKCTSRVIRWKNYRNQIKSESSLDKKIYLRNKKISNIEKKIKKINCQIINQDDSSDLTFCIPSKKDRTAELITADLKNLLNIIDNDNLENIDNIFKNKDIDISSPNTDHIDKIENLFIDDKLSKNLDIISSQISDIEDVHKEQKIELKKNKNHITEIVSNKISDSDATNINLKLLKIELIKKIPQKYTIIFFLFILFALFIIGIILVIILR
ncbi:MAG: hypothetical protein ACRCW6_02805 [Mycoplasmoidaceae bacterium]